MKSVLSSRTLGALMLAALLIVPTAASAAQFRASQRPELQKGEVASGNLYMAGGQVTSAGTVNGDLVAAGGSIFVSGPVSGDTALGGGDITVLNDVSGDLRAVGGNIIINGTVGGDVAAAGGQIMLSGTLVHGDVALVGASVRVEAPVDGNVRIGGGDVYLNSTIKGSVNVKAQSLTLGPKAAIEGNLDYTAAQEATVQQGAVVKGKTVFTPSGEPIFSPAAIAAFFTIAVLARFLMILVAALVFGLILRRYAAEISSKVRQKPFAEFGRGIVYFIVTPVISVALLFTVIGVPLGILGLLGYVAGSVFIVLFAPVVLGSLIYRYAFKTRDYEVNWKTILLGTAVYFLVGLVPFVGWIVKLLFVILVAGAIVSTEWRIAKEWR